MHMNLVLCLLAVALIPHLVAAVDPNEGVVETHLGKVRGLKKSDAWQWNGVPFGQADRFQLPQDPQPWDDVRFRAMPSSPIAPF